MAKLSIDEIIAAVKELSVMELADLVSKAEEEFGDLLFALINYGRMHGINAEDALDKTNRKFRQRFGYVEQKARENGTGVQNLSLDEMLRLWVEAKN